MANNTSETGGERDFFDQLVDDAAAALEAYEAFATRHDTPSTLGTHPARTWVAPGAVTAFQAYPGGLRFTCEGGVVSLDWQGQNCIRVWYTAAIPDGQPFSYAVVPQAGPTIHYELMERDDYILVRTDAMQVVVARQRFSVDVQTLAGRSITHDADGVQRHPTGNVRLATRLRQDETCHGLGERTTSFNLRGGRYGMWNVDQPNCDPGTDPQYYCVPMMVGRHADGAYGIFFDNSYRGAVDVGANQPDTLEFEFEGGEACYYVMAGDSPLTIVGTYTRLTGKPFLPPLWYFGFHQSRFSYRNQAELMEVADGLRDHRIPCDALYLDIHYMDGYRVFTWDTAAFPDLAKTIATLKGRGLQVVPIIDPGVKIDTDYGVYQRGVARGVFLHDADEELVQALIWAGVSHMPDFSNPETRTWWADEAEAVLKIGVSGIWNDMNEPAVFTTAGASTLPTTIRHEREGTGGTHLELHNLYGMLMSRASLEALQRHRPDKRPVNITRAGYAGTQRYATSWTGDVSSEWDHLRLTIPKLLNLGMSGVPFTGPDVGGFRGDTNAELLTRWTQAACLMPFFRNHSAIDTVRQEPWAFGEPYLSHIRAAIELRYRLMPYLYAVAAQAVEYGYPMVRPLASVSPAEEALWEVDDAFMLGDALLVAPVLTEGATRRDVRLPLGVWYDYWTGKSVVGGGRRPVEAPLDHLPLFVRGGAVLPHWEVQQHLSGGIPAYMNLRVYPGKLDMMLYEDAGEGLAYQDGDYRWIALSTYWYNNRLHIKRRTTGKYEAPYERIRMQVLGFDEEPLAVRVDDQGAPVWYYEDGIIELTIQPFALVEITRQVGPSDETIISRPRL